LKREFYQEGGSIKKEGEEKISEYSSTTLSTFFCCVERSAIETLDVLRYFGYSESES